MPIYEYRAVGNGCEYYRVRFEEIQQLRDKPLEKCPRCQSPVRRLPSIFRACVMETPVETAETERRVGDYEKAGMWSHAAELADKSGLEERARDDYKKAGYDL